MTSSESDRIKALTDEELLAEFEECSDDVADLFIDEIGRRKLFPPKRVPTPPTAAEQRSLDDSITILTTPKDELFERLFGDGRLGDSFDRAKTLHDKYGAVGGNEYGQSMQTELQIVLLNVSGDENKPDSVKKALDILEAFYERELKPFQEAGVSTFLSGVQWELLAGRVYGYNS